MTDYLCTVTPLKCIRNCFFFLFTYFFLSPFVLLLFLLSAFICFCICLHTLIRRLYSLKMPAMTSSFIATSTTIPKIPNSRHLFVSHFPLFRLRSVLCFRSFGVGFNIDFYSYHCIHEDEPNPALRSSHSCTSFVFEQKNHKYFSEAKYSGRLWPVSACNMYFDISRYEKVSNSRFSVFFFWCVCVVFVCACVCFPLRINFVFSFKFGFRLTLESTAFLKMARVVSMVLHTLNSGENKNASRNEDRMELRRESVSPIFDSDSMRFIDSGV